MFPISLSMRRQLVDPFQGGVFGRVQRTPRASPVDDLSLVEPVDGLGQSAIVAIAHAANRMLDAGRPGAFGCLIKTYWLPRSE